MIRISFFFSSIRRHTRSTRDWSSDVCSSDLSGTVSVTIAALTIQDVTTQSSSPTLSLSGPTIPAPNFTATITVDTLNSGFYFTHGHTYTFNVITTKQT